MIGSHYRIYSELEDYINILLLFYVLLFCCFNYFIITLLKDQVHVAGLFCVQERIPCYRSTALIKQPHGKKQLIFSSLFER